MHNPVTATHDPVERGITAPPAISACDPGPGAVRAAVHPHGHARDHDGHRRARPAAARHVRARRRAALARRETIARRRQDRDRRNLRGVPRRAPNGASSMPRPRRRRFARAALQSRAGPHCAYETTCPLHEQLSPSCKRLPAPAAGGALAGRTQRRAPLDPPPGMRGPSALRPVPTQRKDALDEFSADPDRRGRTRARAPSSPSSSKRTATRSCSPTAAGTRWRSSPATGPSWCSADINGHTLGLLDAVRGGEGLGRRDRPGHAADRAHRECGRARAGPGVRPRRR